MRVLVGQSLFRRRRGSVIVLVLAMVTLAAFFLTRFIERSMTEMLVEARAQQADRLRADAFSALEATLAVLADYQAVDEGLRSPAQGWGEPLDEKDFTPREGVKIEVAFEDESGKFSLPQLNQAALEKLLVQLGVKEADAPRVAESMLVWSRGADLSTRYETDPRNYEYRDPPHRAPARALESFGELAAVAVAKDFFFDQDGQPQPLLAEFSRVVSLYDFPAVNINAAGPAALEFAGLDETQAGRLTDFNSGKGRRSASDPKYFRDMAEAQMVAGAQALPGFDTLIRCLRIRVTAREGATAYHLDIVVAPPAASAQGQQRQAQRDEQQQTEQQQQAERGEQTTSGQLQYPFAVLALDENIEMQSRPPSS